MLKLSGQPVHSLGDQVTAHFKVETDWYCNATGRVQFNSIVFDREDWREQKQVNISFGNYGCCSYEITAIGGGYEIYKARVFRDTAVLNTKIFEMRQTIYLLLLTLFLNQCSSQKGFPEQFQATLNITSLQQYPLPTLGLQQLLYDYTNSRVRFDIKGWLMKQNETYMVQYKPKGAEADTPPSKGFTMFNFNPDYPDRTKNNCWYRTNPMKDAGPFPIEWYGDGLSLREVQRWFPLPSDLINKGEEWVPEIQGYAVRYDSPEMCDLKKSGIGLVPCLSYFEAPDRPVKSVEAHVGRTAYDYDEYLTTVYLSFTNGITPDAEHLFDLPNQWSAYCGNADTGFNVEPFRNFVVTPDGQDNLKLTLQAPPVHAPTDQVTIEFKVQPNYFYNGTRCAEFSKVVFDKTNWQVPQQITMSFVDYGCCSYAITGNGGGYDWQYTIATVVVYACDGEAGVACKGKYTYSSTPTLQVEHPDDNGTLFKIRLQIISQVFPANLLENEYDLLYSKIGHENTSA
ncbi:unnamed protein product [Rotaria magnacalcarata]